MHSVVLQTLYKQIQTLTNPDELSSQFHITLLFIYFYILNLEI